MIGKGCHKGTDTKWTSTEEGGRNELRKQGGQGISRYLPQAVGPAMGSPKEHTGGKRSMQGADKAEGADRDGVGAGGAHRCIDVVWRDAAPRRSWTLWPQTHKTAALLRLLFSSFVTFPQACTGKQP